MKTIFCKWCGATAGSAGEQTKCPGNHGHAHNFVALEGTVYCKWCGMSPNSTIGGQCILNSSFGHSFVSNSGKVFCEWCGVLTGSPSKCMNNNGKTHSWKSEFDKD